MSTREIAGLLDIDPHAFNQRRYRGKAPPSLPSKWFVGNAIGYLAADAFKWAAHSLPFEVVHAHVLRKFGDEAARADTKTVVWFATAAPFTMDLRGVLSTDLRLKKHMHPEFANEVSARLAHFLETIDTQSQLTCD